MQRIQAAAIDNAPEASKPVMEKIKANKSREFRISTPQSPTLLRRSTLLCHR